MHLLTSDRQTQSQLSLLLRDLGYIPKFHNEIKELSHALKSTNTSEPVLFDLNFKISESNIQRLQSMSPLSKFICFERIGLGVNPTPRPMAASSFAASIIIPHNAERAKQRLKHVLRSRNQLKRASNAISTRPSFQFKKRNTTPQLPTKNETIGITTKELSARYLVCNSLDSHNLLNTLKQCSNETGLIILEANEDAEFEITARELNYQSNSDTNSLYVINQADIRIDFLEKLERCAKTAKTPINCYLGRTDELDADAARELELFNEYLNNLRNPYMRLTLAHESGTSELYQHGVEAYLKRIQKKATKIRIPRLANRPEDIPSICQITLGHLRSIHPFLLVQRIPKETEHYLLKYKEQYSYTKLVRVLRNAIALSQRENLSVEDLKNYGESDMTTQHLLETMADERYFPQTANF